MLLHIILIFIVGVLYEASCVGFVHYTEHGPRSKAVIVTIFAGALQTFGLLNIIQNPTYAVSLILGYGMGTFLAMSVRK